MVKAKLLARSKNTSKSLWNIRFQEDELDRDLGKLIQQIKKYKTLTECEEESEPGLSNIIDFDLLEISRKILLLEQIIAESFTESELLKKYYHAKRNMKIKAIDVPVEGDKTLKDTKGATVPFKSSVAPSQN